MPVNNAVVVAVNAVLNKVWIDGIFFIANAVRKVLIATIEAVLHVPVIVNGWCFVTTWGTLPGICHEAQTHKEHNNNDCRENCSALKADFFPFALLSQSGDFFG